MPEVNEAGQLQLIEPPFIRIERNKLMPLALTAQCVHGTEYHFAVDLSVVRERHVWLAVGVERFAQDIHGTTPGICLPSRFGVPQTWTELVNLAYRVLVEAPCHHP